VNLLRLRVSSVHSESVWVYTIYFDLSLMFRRLWLFYHRGWESKSGGHQDGQHDASFSPFRPTAVSAEIEKNSSLAANFGPVNRRKDFRIWRWWPETGSNRRRRPFQGRALPLSYLALAWSTPDSGQPRESPRREQEEFRARSGTAVHASC
jgi:hypothetical protein